MTAERLERLHPHQRCSLCREPLVAEPDDLATCPACETTYHRGCLDELGGCATRGCRQTGPTPRERRGRARELEDGVGTRDEEGHLRLNPFWSLLGGWLGILAMVLFLFADAQRWPLGGLRIALARQGIPVFALGFALGGLIALAYPVWVHAVVFLRERTKGGG